MSRKYQTKGRSILMAAVISLGLYLFAGVNLTYAADSIIDTGTCGDNVTWELTGTETDMVLTITGTGQMKDYWDDWDNIPWHNNISTIKSIIIEKGVSSISYNAFAGCSSLTNVTIPDSVTDIYGCAFEGCSNLTSITIPNSVKGIGDYAFAGCSSLTDILIPNSVTGIDSNAFAYCSSLTSIIIPDSVTYMGEYCTFFGCSNLTSVTLSNSITSIGGETFSECSSLTSITIPNGVTSIGEYVFRGCNNLTDITIPQSVSSIGTGAFMDCTNLREVHYEGDNASWNAISIGKNNEYLINAIGYNQSDPNDNSNEPEENNHGEDKAYTGLSLEEELSNEDRRHNAVIAKVASLQAKIDTYSKTVEEFKDKYGISYLQSSSYYNSQATSLEETISQKMNRLATLRSNTSGGNQVEIARLEKEIDSLKSDYKMYLELEEAAKLQEKADDAQNELNGIDLNAEATKHENNIAKLCAKHGVKDSSVAEIEYILLDSNEYDYTGETIHPILTVIDSKGNQLGSESYDVDYPEDCISPGEHVITLKLKQNYVGTKEKVFRIVKHEYGEWMITKESTCNEEGTREKTCIDCGKKIIEVIPAHNLVKIEGKAATYDDEGTETYWSCTRCGKLFSDEKGKTEIAEPIIVDKLPKKQATPVVTLSSKEFVYNGKLKTPSVTVSVKGKILEEDAYDIKYPTAKKVGNYRVIITLAKGEYKGKATSSFKIVPKKPDISKVTVGTKKVTIKMKNKVAKTGGKNYQIAYKVKGTSKWKYTTTTKQSKVIKKLKTGKKYQLKVRAYKKIGKTTYYSSWCKTRTTKPIK